MLKINLVCVGTLKEKYLADACSEYQKRLSRFCRLSVVELPELDPEKVGRRILEKLEGFTVALCVEGKKLSSEGFAELIAAKSLEFSTYTFVIGGSEGLSDEVKRNCRYALSFSAMTFPHQLMRVILLEQLYRGFMINAHNPYHK